MRSRWFGNTNLRMAVLDRQFDEAMCGAVEMAPPCVSAALLTLAAAVALLACGSRTGLAVPDREPRDSGDGVDASVDAGSPGSLRFIHLDAGGRHACGLEESGRVFCWGDNHAEQLGIDMITAGSAEPVVSSRFSAPTRFFSLGSFMTCAISSEDGVTCSGDLFSARVPDAADDIAPGTGSICTRSDAGSVVCNGVLGADAVGRDLILIADGATDLAVGTFMGCGIVGGQVSCWGENNDGELARPVGSTDRHRTYAIELPEPLVGVAPGASHGCAWSATGRAYCWGSNVMGQVGVSGDHDLQPVLVEGVEEVTSMASGHGNSCAVTAGGEVLCWGDNTFGQIGRDTPGLVAPPTRVPLDRPIVQVAVGDGFACARDESGAIWCWGRNHKGQLGDGTHVDRARPALVEFPDE